MTEYDNSNRLALWLNDKRDKQTSPHLTGSGEVSGGYFANAWFADDLSDDDKRVLQDILKRHAQVSKRPFLSISVKAKEERQQSAPPAASGFEDDDPSSIPF